MKQIILNKSRRGFTLVEVIVTMAVFIVVLIIAAQTFNTIVTNSSKYSKIEESNIEGIVGLEVMRHDLEQMGFGLPWSFHDDNITYSESTVADSVTNDAPHGIPRAFVGLEGFSNFTTDFIAVKGSTIGSNKASQRWSYIPYHNFSSSAGYESRPVSFTSNNLQPGDHAIVLRTTFNNQSTSSPVSRQPVQQLMGSGSSFYFNMNYIGPEFLPKSDQDTHFVYGIRSDPPRMPFNRADFFISVPTGGSPPFCAPRTGVLYKQEVINTGVATNGGYTPMPLLDCVANMQVVLGWSANAGVGKLQDNVDTYSNLPRQSDHEVTNKFGSIPLADIKDWLQDPQMIREHLKMIKVYILAQEGKRDASYTYPEPSILVGDQESITKRYYFTEEQRHYRWKLYRIIVRPKNLASNQR